MENAKPNVIKQLAELWAEPGINQKVSLVVSGVAVIAGMLAIAFWSSQADYRLLYGNLDNTEASRVTAALSEAKIPYEIGEANKIPIKRNIMLARMMYKMCKVGGEIPAELFAAAAQILATVYR